MGGENQRRFSFTLLLLAVALALAYTVGLIVDWPSWLHGANWVWVRHTPMLSWIRLGLLTAILLFWLAVLIWVLDKQGEWSRRQTALLLGWAILFTPAMQLVVAAQHRSQPLAVAFLTAVNFFQEGVRIEDPVDFIQQHPAQMPVYRNVHLRTQPPGWPVAFWATRQLWEQIPGAAGTVGHWLLRYDCFSTDLRGLTPAQIAAATLQMSLVFLSGLGVLPLYGLGRELFSPFIARLAAVAYPLLPGLLVFQARFDVFYALVAITALWLAHRFITRRRYWNALLLALLLAGVSFFGFGPLVTILLVNAYLVLSVWMAGQFRHNLSSLLFLNGVILLALLLFWGIVWLLWGVSWPQIYRIGRDIHQTLRLNYPAWGLFNLYDFGVFLGLSLLVWAIAGGIGALRRLIGRASRPEDAFILGWWFFLLCLNLSGEVKSETGRIWLFLAFPGLLIGIAALVQAFRTSKVLRPALLLVLVAFAVQAAITGYFLGGRVSEATVPEARWFVPGDATRLSYQLGDTIALQGYTAQPSGDDLAVTLYWRALGWTHADYLAFVHLLNEQGELATQSDSAPANGRLPTWCWVPGEVVEDVHVLPGAGAAGSAFQLGVGLYDWRTGERLPVTPPAADQIIWLPLTN